MTEIRSSDAGTPLQAGSAAPDFRFKQGAEWHTLEQRDGPTWLFFYPLAFAPVPRTDLAALDQAAELLGAPGAKLVVSSVDSEIQAELFLTSLSAKNLLLAADPQLAIAHSYGVARPEGVAEMASVLIDKEGTIQNIQVHELCFPRPIDELKNWWRAMRP